MDIKKRLENLRKEMKREGIDAYLIPSSDYNGSEYVNEHFRCREYMSGFTGSAGTLLVERDTARLWTDGRYFIQAQRQLKGSGISLMKSGEPEVPEPKEYMMGLPPGTVIGFDGRTVDAGMAQSLSEKFQIVTRVDLVERIWENRPALISSEVYSLSISVTGESRDSKLQRIKKEMKAAGADYLFLNSLEEIAWLYNLRGSDIPGTPVFYAFALISMDENELFVMDEKLLKEHENAFPYDEVYDRLAKMRDCSIMLSEDFVSWRIVDSLYSSVKTIFAPGPVEKLKAIKNPAEIAATRQAHIRDGAAMVKFLYMAKTGKLPEGATERTVCRILEEFRREQGAYDLSFATIAAFEENGAIIHYTPTEETDKILKNQGFLLVDSGGQYSDGTTDITRTISFGEVCETRKKAYTAVLKGHISLALAAFEHEDGADLDAKARELIKSFGYDYKHGTGHGVGHMLGVHEGPNVISPRGKGSKILPGMITTDEPGVYIENDFGIRIENELLCVERGGCFAFEPLTLCPYERDAINVNMLSSEEKTYIDEYHKKVYETLAPLLKREESKWLKEVCRPIA